MAGEFTSFHTEHWDEEYDMWETDWDGIVDGNRLMGESHGCGCCAEKQEITEESLLEHIKALRKAEAEAVDMLRRFFGKVMP